jgi:outer membrane protein assembly factor BamB
MVMSGSKCVTSYNPETGELLWSIKGPTDQFVASPVFSERTGLFYVTGGFPDHHILAIRPDGKGDVTETHVVWHHNNIQGVAYVPSPIIEGDYLLINDDQGFAHAFDAARGDVIWKERFGRTHASLCSAEGKVYFINDNGLCRVVDVANGFKVLSENDMKEMTYASPALSNGEIFLRTSRAMYCVKGGR